MNILIYIKKIECHDGISAYIEYLIRSLQGEAIDFFLACGPINADDSSKRRKSYILSSVKNIFKFPNSKSIPSIKNILSVINFIKIEKIQVLHSHGLSTAFAARVISLVCGVPLIISYHPSAHGDINNIHRMARQKFDIFKRIYIRLFFPDVLIVLSEENRKNFAALFPKQAKKIVKIHGGVDIAHYRIPSKIERSTARNFYGFQDSWLICTLFGRLNWNKGHDILISAAKIIDKKRPDINIKCLFVGGGGDSEAIKELAIQNDPDRRLFIFLNFIEDARSALWASDLLVLPSRVEGFALVVAEAMATGLVPIRTPSGGAIDQIIEDYTGKTVPFEDPYRLAEAIIQLSDIRMRQSLSLNCRNHAREKFSLENMATEMMSLYKLVINDA